MRESPLGAAQLDFATPMRRHFPFLVLALATAACSSATGSGDNGAADTGNDEVATDPETGEPIDSAPPPSELVNNLAITEISLFQGTKTVLEKDGTPGTAPTSRARIVAGRPGRIRVYVKPLEGWAARDVVGVLTITSGGGTVTTIVDTKTIEIASTDRAIDSTINFDVPSGIIDLGATYNVSLRTGPGQPAGTNEGARYPAGDASDGFNAQDVGETFKVMLVPFANKGYTPDLSDEAIEKWRAALYAFYPVKAVEIKVHATIAWGTTISPISPSSWTPVLNRVLQLRETEGNPDYFYYGFFTPASSFNSFCASGCLGGLAPLNTDPSDTYTRGAIGLGWPSDFGFSTMAQELAHSLGRQHAPCGGAGQVDPSFPYKDGSIGAWGWNLNTQTLVLPTAKDFMGYCTEAPNWTSDYTFGAILTRLAYINLHANVYMPGGAKLAYRSVDVAPDGHLTWGDPVKLSMPPASDPHTVTYLDKDGHVLQSATGYYYPYDRIAGGILLVPDAPTGFAKMRVERLAGIDRWLAR
jgi:hypothetical protein